MNTQRVYLDHAASTPLDDRVLEEMLPLLKSAFGNPSSVHDHGRKLKAKIEVSRKKIADLVGCAPAEIVFTSGGTEADNYALQCAVRDHGVKRIISSPLEHHAVLYTVEYLEKTRDVERLMVNVDHEGRVDLDHLHTLLQHEDKTLVSLMHANNEIGTLLDLEAVGALCEEHGALFHTDTVQSIGLYNLNLTDLPVHYTAASAHKFNGPRGIGFMYVESGFACEPLIWGGAQERNQRGGTENVAAIVGMAKALELTYDQLDEKRQYLGELKAHMLKGLRELFPELKVNGPEGEGAMPSVLNVCFPIEQAQGMLMMNLDINGVSASGGSACASGSVTGSHVLRAIGLSDAQNLSSVRFSFGKDTTRDELDYALGVVKKVLAS